MSELSDILTWLALLLAGAEVALHFFKDQLLRLRQAAGIEKQIEETKAETVKAKEQMTLREAELAAARSRNDQAQAAARQASQDFTQSQEQREIMVYEVGEPGTLPRFRATLRKTAATLEPNQALLWSFENYVDVWATNPATATAVASRLFTAKAGYELGEFQPAVEAPPATSETAAA